MTQTVNTNEVVFDTTIYPRKSVSRKTVEVYTAALDLGATFPPIEIQRVTNYKTPGSEALVLIDGAHRLTAYQEKKVPTIEVVEWQPGATLDFETVKLDLLLVSAERNTKHGDRLGETDKYDVARSVAYSDPQARHTEDEIAGRLGVSRQRVNEWITDIRARQRASRESIIIRLARLGWTQAEIAQAVGLDQSVISRIMQNAEIGNLHNLLAQGRDMAYIADLNSMDLALAWALRLDGKTDQERFSKEELNWGLRTWDMWNFNDCDSRFGDDWPGRIPAQLVAHTLFYFTNQGDLVFDPMAGGGVVPDTCLAFGRKCRAFDLATREKRPEIQKHEWVLDAMTWPELDGYGKKPHLIFFDPPYFTKMKADYQEKANGKGTPISDLSRAEYLRFFAQFFALARANIRQGGRLAFLNADWRDFQSTAALDENPTNAITMFDYGKLITGAGWEITHIIDCPLSSERFNGNEVKHMQENRTLGTVRRTLLVARGS